MYCAVNVAQPDSKPPSPAPAPIATADKPIKSTHDLIKQFPDQFTGIGRFPGEYTICFCHDVYPIIHDPRKCPIALCPGQGAPQQNGMHRSHPPMDQPTDWVSSITYIMKANGKICLYLDPHDLNKAIHHDHHKTPTVEEVAHEFTHSCYFTKLDACHGYWSIILDQESSLITTFNSPFRRYHFPHLPLALSAFKTSSRRRWTRS